MRWLSVKFRRMRTFGHILQQRLFIAVLAAALLLLFACTPGNINPDPEPSDDSVSAITLEAQRISALSVILNGKAILSNDIAPESVVCGFQYYKSDGKASSVLATDSPTDKGGEFKYSLAITDLEPNTTYKYRSFVRRGGKDTFGWEREFTTKDLESLLKTGSASFLNVGSVELSATADFSDVLVAFKKISYGFCWGISGADPEEENYIECKEIKNNSYSASLINLSPSKQYRFKAYARLDERIVYGETKPFTAKAIPVESVSLDYSEFIFINPKVSNTTRFTATVYPPEATDKSLIWTSSNPDVVEVKALNDGRADIKAIGNGTAIVTVKTVDQEKTAECIITVGQIVTGITLIGSTLSLHEGEETTITALIEPADAANKSLDWTSSAPSVANVDDSGKVTAISEGKATITATAKDSSKKSATIDIVVKPAMKAVDLGLSVKWANENTGIEYYEYYGAFFAWGETRIGNPRFNWSEYEFGGNSYQAPYKYNTSDGKTVLDPENDAAHKFLGSNWRMPTDEEWKELIAKCDWVWKENYGGPGVNGMLVTANNGNSIFLPAAGHGEHVMSGRIGVGTEGNYWSSTLDDTGAAYWTPIGCCAWCVEFSSANDVKRSSLYRCSGYSVRAVTK